MADQLAVLQHNTSTEAPSKQDCSNTIDYPGLKTDERLHVFDLYGQTDLQNHVYTSFAASEEFPFVFKEMRMNRFTPHLHLCFCSTHSIRSIHLLNLCNFLLWNTKDDFLFLSTAIIHQVFIY